MTTAARIVSLNRSNGGVPKLPVEQATVGVGGMEGDRQRDRRFHGGPNRALSLYSIELIEHLALEGHPIGPGSLGENVTIGGIDWREMVPGRRVLLGELVIELTSYAAPCKTIRHSFLGEDFTRISQKLFPGWSRVYACVVSEGTLHVGDAVGLATTKESTMLANRNALATVPVKDLERARKFYHETLGLQPSGNDSQPGVVTFRAGSSAIIVYQSTFAGTNQATAVTWPVGDELDTIVAGLAKKGVVFEHYQMAHATLEGDVHVFGRTRVAWFKDPDGNIINLGNY